MNLKPIVAIIACGLVTTAVAAYGPVSHAKPASKCALHMSNSDKLSMGNSYLTDTSCDWFNRVGVSLDAELFWQNRTNSPTVTMQGAFVGASGVAHSWNSATSPATVGGSAILADSYGNDVGNASSTPGAGGIADANTTGYSSGNGKSFQFNNINIGVNTNINDKVMGHIGINASNNVTIDEAFAVWDLGKFNLKFGRSWSHFGKYDAYRNNKGMIQEWSQFNSTGIELGAGISKHAYVYAFTYGRNTRGGGATNTTSRLGNWGGGIDYSMKRGRFNVGFDASIIGDASNLTDSQTVNSGNGNFYLFGTGHGGSSSDWNVVLDDASGNYNHAAAYQVGVKVDVGKLNIGARYYAFNSALLKNGSYNNVGVLDLTSASLSGGAATGDPYNATGNATINYGTDMPNRTKPRIWGVNLGYDASFGRHHVGLYGEYQKSDKSGEDLIQFKNMTRLGASMDLAEHTSVYAEWTKFERHNFVVYAGQAHSAGPAGGATFVTSGLAKGAIANSDADKRFTVGLHWEVS